MNGHFCQVPRVSVHDRYYCIPFSVVHDIHRSIGILLCRETMVCAVFVNGRSCLSTFIAGSPVDPPISSAVNKRCNCLPLTQFITRCDTMQTNPEGS